MLSITVPTPTGGKYGCVEANLGTKDLIFILAPECVLKSTHPLDALTSHQYAGGHSRLVAQKEWQEPRRLDDCVRRHAQLFHIIASAVFRLACPAVPPLDGAIDHRGFRMRFQDRHLFR